MPVNCIVLLLSITGTVILLTMSGTTVLTLARYRVCTTLLMVRSVGESVHRQERSTGGVINHRDGVVKTRTLNGTTALLALTVQGRHSSILSPVCLLVRYNAECLDECATRGSDKFWCKIAGDTWDYCSPAVPNTPAKTVEGRKCTGACDYFSSSYLWCTSFTTENDGWWDYCGASTSSKQFSYSVLIVIGITFLMVKAL